MRVRVLSRYTRVVKQSNSVSLENPQLKAVYLWRIYPPKLSNMIMSSSTPNECSKSSTVLDIIGGPRQNGLATKNSLGSLGLPAFFLFPKIGRFLGALFDWVPLRLNSHEKDSA